MACSAVFLCLIFVFSFSSCRQLGIKECEDDDKDDLHANAFAPPTNYIKISQGKIQLVHQPPPPSSPVTAGYPTTPSSPPGGGHQQQPTSAGVVMSSTLSSTATTATLNGYHHTTSTSSCNGSESPREKVSDIISNSSPQEDS